jgi:HK97 family phage major capsid protein
MQMKMFLKNYRHLTALALVLFVAALGITLGIFPPAAGLLIVGLWQLSQIALSKRRAGAFYMAALTPEQLSEFEDIIRGLKAEAPKIGKLAEKFDQLEKLYDQMNSQLRNLKRSHLNGGNSAGAIRWIGNVPFVTDDCAAALTSFFIVDCCRTKGALENLFPDETKRLRLLQLAQNNLGIQQRAGGALNSTDIPLPTIYVPQIIELVFAYGAARQYATVFPLGSTTVKLPRLKAGEDNFGYLGAGTAGQSQNVPQKEVATELVTFTANKAGGIIRFPTELEEDTFIPFGQFLARYIARQFAKLEDSTMFLADGTVGYANQTGVGPYCVANNGYLRQLAATKTKVTDATLNDFRAMRGLVSAAVIANMAANGQAAAAYYMHPSLESLLVTFNTIGSPMIYIPSSQGRPPTLDGFPIRWIGVSAGNVGQAAPGSFIAFFGDLSYWYLGERGTPRVEVSREVFFATDELAMRALERIDVESMAVDAMSTLQTAAA